MCLQARRIATVTTAELSASVDRFLEGRWAKVSRKFVYATRASTRSTELVHEIEKLAAQLLQRSIEYVVWDQEEISRRLKNHPELVDDFFGRHWVKEFCGDEAATRLGGRLDAGQVAKLRCELARIYAASFGVADSGMIAFRFSETHPVALPERFVIPDLVTTTPQAAPLPQPEDDLDELDTDGHDLLAAMAEAAAWAPLTRDEGMSFPPNAARRHRHLENPRVLDRRPADQWIGVEPLQVIVGDPGAGKSTLLRHLVLDLLSREPRWRTVAERLGQYLPIWLPFHFFTQRVAGQTGAAASIGEALKAWLEQHDAGQIWPLVKAALNDQRLLLVVDGLDEWVSDEAGQYAVAALKTFADSRSTPLVVSTRPYGLSQLTLGAGWTYRRIAPLNPDQQRLLALHYFRAVIDSEDRPSSPDTVERSIDDFLSQIRNVPGLRAISGTPLFLVLLVGLRLSSVGTLPAERFEVYDQAVQLLVADHPTNRRVAAAVTTPRRGLSVRQLRAVLANVAFVSQARGDISTLEETRLREDFLHALCAPARLAMNAADAAETADQLLNVAEGELGLLVRKGATELGFLHRILQEQLAAEYISDQLTPAAMNELFAEHIGDPRWREVLLATMSRLRRPSELSDLMGAIRRRVDETPTGLRAREILAEVVFGPYDLPAGDIQKSAPGIIEVIETHPYGPHRARLLDSVLAGLEGAATEDIVRDCLERWTLLVQEPSSTLVREIAQITQVGAPSETACKLLLMALLHPHGWIADASAVAIAGRCSNSRSVNNKERDLLRRELLHILSNPPSGLAQAAALMALALEWRHDPLVEDILNDARGHADESVRIVALSDALGVLRTTLCDSPTELPSDIQQLSDVEREWLIEHLRNPGFGNTHPELLVAAVSEAVRGQHSVLEDLVESLQSASGPYRNSDLIWPVALNLLGDDDRVVHIVCDQLRSEENSSLGLRVKLGNGQLLALAYPPESPRNGRVAAAIEDRLRTFTKRIDGPELWRLAAVDRGPMMKTALLEDLATSPWPHWSADALVDYFGEDADARDALHSVLMGNPVRASMVANVATSALATGEVIPRLLAILRDLAGPANPGSGRYDILASAIFEACQEQEIGPAPEIESVAAEALGLMPSGPNPFGGDPRYMLAAAFYPSAASKAALAELAEAEDRPLEPILPVFRHDPEQVERFLEDASTILRSLPAYLRARVCQSLADGAIAPDAVVHLTRRWADEVSEPNKSIASLAYHRALLRAREEGHVDNEQWDRALVYLGKQASCYGPDHEARRRSAWVGMCVCGDWSMLEGRVETIGESLPVGVSLADPFHGPDGTLLQQLASCWEDLRSEFGDTLLPRLSGLRAEEPKSDVWNALALVAGRNTTLQQELESAIAADPGLLGLNGVLVWCVTRLFTGDSPSTDAITDALVTHLLQYRGDQRERLVSVLVAQFERIGLQQEELLGRLDDALRGVPVSSGDPTREALSALIAGSRCPTGHPFRPRTSFDDAFAAADSSEIFERIERTLDWLDGAGETYYDDPFIRRVPHRLRSDTVAAGMVRDAVMNPATPDSRAAALVSLLAEAVGLDEDLLREVERRIIAQNNVRLAPVMRERDSSTTISVQTVFTRVADVALDLRLS